MSARKFCRFLSMFVSPGCPLGLPGRLFFGEAQMGSAQMGRQLFSKWNRVSSIWGRAWDVSVFPGRICCGGFTGNSGGPGTWSVPGLVPGPGSCARFMGPPHGPWPTGPGPRARPMGTAHGPWLPWDNDFQLWAQSPRLFWEIKIVVTTIFRNETSCDDYVQK